MIPVHPRVADHRIIADTVAHTYCAAAKKFADHPAVCIRQPDGSYEPITYEVLYERAVALATAFIDLGLQARENVGLIADNRYEWSLCDYAVLIAGAADVPRGTDITEAELTYILGHSDCRFAVVENDSCLARLMRVREHLPQLEKIIVMAPKADFPPHHRGEPHIWALADLLRHGQELCKVGDQRVKERLAQISPDDLYTIIYTSGTTGTPKGVALTHAGMCAQIRNVPIVLKERERALSILPVWHSYERLFTIMGVASGLSVHYTSIRTIADDLKTVRPNIMTSAPRLWENLYLKLLARINSGPAVKRILFKAALRSNLCVKKALLFFKGQSLDTTGRRWWQSALASLPHLVRLPFYFFTAKLLDKIVLSKVRELTGFSEFRGTISGGGALQPHVDDFFCALGIPILEGYGLTESGPVLSVRTWANFVVGTVGPLFNEVELRIVDLDSGKILCPDPNRRGEGRGLRGELHVKAPQVMRGYYKDPEITAKVLKDGWLNTGDIAMVTYNDCFKILGRSKDTIVLLSGENIEPVPIESRLCSSALVDQCMVTGQDQKNLGAVIVPAREGFAAAGVSDIANDPRARSLMEVEIKKLIGAHTGFKPFERIPVFRFIFKPFEVGTEITNTFKIKRHVIYKMYGDLIEEMHGGSTPPPEI